MEIIIKPGDSIPSGKYELKNLPKLINAKGNVPFGSERDVLLEYDRIAGLLVRDGQALPPASIWQSEKAHESRPIETFTDAELQVVIRRAENTNIPGSLYQKAENEWKFRQDEKMLQANTREKWNSDKTPFGYPTSCNSDQIREVIQDLTEERHRKLQGGKVNPTWEKVINGLIESGRKELEERREVRRWYERPLGMITIGVLIGLIVAYAVHKLGWV